MELALTDDESAVLIVKYTVHNVTCRNLFSFRRYIVEHAYAGCPRKNVPYFGRVFLMLKYKDITKTPIAKVERLRI
jgi:hypothetical protein